MKEIKTAASQNGTPGSFKWLAVLSRIAFICNVCFLVAFSIQMTDWIKNEDLTSLIALVGYVMGFILNPVLNVLYLIFFIVAPKKLRVVPAWLFTANILFLVIQVLYILYLNDTKHP